MHRLLVALLSVIFPLAGLTAAGAPEITVLHGGVEIVDGSTDIVFGAVISPAPDLAVTYVIANTGALPLTVGTVTLGGQSNCTATISTTPSSSVNANASTTLGLQVSTTAAAAWFFTISFPTNDSDEATTNWTVSGTAATAAAPEVNLLKGTTAIPDGGGDTLSGTVRGIWETVAYTIRNEGSANLTLSAPTATPTTAGCLATISSLAATLAPGESTTLTVSVQPPSNLGEPAAWAVNIQFTCNDSDEGTYDWLLSGTADPSGSEITISRNGGVIINGGLDAAPGGTANSPVELTYLVVNNGSAPLTCSTPTYSNMVNCMVTPVFSPISPVAPSNNTSFRIQVTPASNADWSLQVSMANSDANEDPSVWTIHGTATAGGSSGSSSTSGSGSCGAGAPVGLLVIALLVLGLRRRR